MKYLLPLPAKFYLPIELQQKKIEELFLYIMELEKRMR